MLCCESIPALQLDIPASGPYRRSHVFDTTPPVAAPHGRAGTPHYFRPEIRALVTMQLLECSISGHNLVYQLPSDRLGLLVRDGETFEPFQKKASHHEAVLVSRRGDRVGTIVSSALRSRICCRSCSGQLASQASKNPVPPAPGCVPCPDGLLSPLHGTGGEGCCADPPGRPTGAAIPVPPTRGTVGAVLRLPGITVPTGAIAPWPLVIPARCPPNGAGHSRPTSTSFLSGGHFLWGPTRLASLTPGHCPYCFSWGLTVSPALPAPVPGEGVCIQVLPARSVLERDVIGVDNLNPSRRLSYWVFIPVQPAHSAVVRPDCDLLPV